MASIRPASADSRLGQGKRTRLRRLLHAHGPGNGTLLMLAADGGLEHGALDTVEHPDRATPQFAIDAAMRSCSAILASIGMAEKYMDDVAGRLPLVLSLNGKTDVPPDDEALAPLIATVEDGARLGADAVAYTLYAGSPAQFEDFTQFATVRRDCQSLGMPLIVRAMPRGAAIERRGGPSSLYALAYAARVADELGADVVALDLPVANPQRDAQAPKPYNTLQLGRDEAARHVVVAANRTPLLFATGSASSKDDLEGIARTAMDAGAAGLLIERGLWQHPTEDAQALVHALSDVLRSYPA